MRAVNGLTARWAGTASGGTVFSATGVWPLLALLADAAGGAARTELAEAVGIAADEAAAAGRELLGALESMRGVDTALGLWTRRTLPVREDWAGGLPVDTFGVLSGDVTADKATLDAWAAQRTGGLIERMPAPLDEDTLLVLASALALRTRWLQPFEPGYLSATSGPWKDRHLAGLLRTTGLLDRIGVADTPAGAVTELKVLGTTGVDVHLLLGEERMSASQVLAAGVDVLARRHRAVPGEQLPYGEVGPGLNVRKVRCYSPTPPSLNVATVAFDFSAEHDLLQHPRLFGLDAARDDSRGHFPGISHHPLAVGSANQAATTAFTDKGFRAAAVTALSAIAGCAMPFERPAPRYVTTEIDAVFHRPFGFLAVHRTSRLVLAAGWVTEPEPFREDEEY
ncbi:MULTISPECIES: serpin family protein [Streptomyces]|uniref:Proteinase inhibitor I4 serpin n=1 Tax=Streptomyces dengpaensis TaxID=2049881 RepID=A0ABM6SQR9_9ACTN|nr:MULTISPECIES: serpin family protein [Streptomyces]AVH56737.1 proteinase inhibitor I4 serpin [Streptomyces dengpaensis]PIB10234.1 proteinase inhibitor I4 serpin [Streptomyces sp. HG99]